MWILKMRTDYLPFLEKHYFIQSPYEYPNRKRGSDCKGMAHIAREVLLKAKICPVGKQTQIHRRISPSSTAQPTINPPTYFTLSLSHPRSLSLSLSLSLPTNLASPNPRLRFLWPSRIKTTPIQDVRRHSSLPIVDSSRSGKKKITATSAGEQFRFEAPLTSAGNIETPLAYLGILIWTTLPILVRLDFPAVIQLLRFLATALFPMRHLAMMVLVDA